MATLNLRSKKHIGSGNFEYAYACFCSPKPLKQITVTAGNDDEAKQLAQQECDEYCGHD